MKIMILANDAGGLYLFRKELIQKLINDGHKLYVSLPDSEYKGKIKKLGCKCILTAIERRGMNPLKDFRLFARYCQYLKRVKPDVVLTYTIKPNIYGGLVCQLLGIPYITNITGLGTAIESGSLLSGVLLRMYKAAMKRATTVFFQNATNKHYFISKKIVKSGKLIPGSGVNLVENCYEEYPGVQEGIYLLFVGRIMKDKGIEELIDCAKYLCKKYSQVHVDIVGGYDDESYKIQIETLQEKGILKAYGEQEGVHSFMKSHHAIILPSYHEGLSNVLLEAAACGRPVLTTNVPGCLETFDEGVTGFGCEPRNSKALIQIVEKFVDLPYEEKKNMGIKAREKVVKEFDRNIVINAYAKEIESVYGGNKNDKFIS